MKNKLIDLNNHLFAQIERLSDETVKGEELKEEMARSKAVAQIASQIVANGRLALDAQKLTPELPMGRRMPQMLENTNG
ncbi:hypothetical protein H5185_06440 [Shewanella sp. SG44-6]|jgi:hypothetical protein|uniref:hypothetical protein n=1 Tax=Shewanella sp. SG44-6 TaxID=2760959 RepID=UPI0016023B4F|nr:hypothetical protein [Shewanella sp. SG44-6]MBB1389067.1 hypothetical protein [Shewanella sp. SG44-6]